MKFTVATIAAFAGLVSGQGYKGMLQKCSGFSIAGLNGGEGRAVMLSATCSGKQSDLDINDCFGWDTAGGNMIMPPSGGFTNFVANCSNTNSGDSDFGNKFGCWGPWTGYSDDYYQFALNSYIGVGNDGYLTC